MMTFTLTAKGMFELAIRADRDRVVAEAMRDAWVQTLREYATGTMPAPASANILDRFKPQAFTRFGFTERSAGYQRRQMRILGELRPFYSPRSLNWIKVAQAIAKPSATGIQSALRSMSRFSKPHLRDQISLPGIGHNITTSGTKRIRIQLTYRAARALNAHPFAAAEFRDLARGGTAGRLLRRAQNLYRQRISQINAASRGTKAA